MSFIASFEQIIRDDNEGVAPGRATVVCDEFDELAEPEDDELQPAATSPRARTAMTPMRRTPTR
jgi:hypothetical protein